MHSVDAVLLGRKAACADCISRCNIIKIYIIYLSAPKTDLAMLISPEVHFMVGYVRRVVGALQSGKLGHLHSQLKKTFWKRTH